MKAPAWLIERAIAEDLGRAGDLTTDYFVPKNARVSARVVAKAPGIVCGTEIAARVFKKLSPRCRLEIFVRDGQGVRPGRTIMSVRGDRRILTAERTALNFLQRLSGIATATQAFVRRVRGTRAGIYDTRKTLPGWRALEKYAALCGGGRNHRFGLYDMVLIKDNHWAFGGLKDKMRRFRRARPGMIVEIEADRMSRVRQALSLGADMILLDNMPESRLKAALRLIRRRSPRTLIEISGGVNPSNVRRLARLGPDRISVGALTHSAPALDMSLEMP